MPSCRLRIMTYNVHRCIGCDRALDPERVARITPNGGPATGGRTSLTTTFKPTSSGRPLAPSRTISARWDAADGRHRLRKLTPDAIIEDRDWVQSLADASLSFDPGRPVLEDTLHERVPALSRGIVWLRDWLRGGG